MRMWPPACGDQGCVSHLTGHPARCICPRWFDSAGTHLVEMNPGCPEHVVESLHKAGKSRAAMEHTARLSRPCADPCHGAGVA